MKDYATDCRWVKISISHIRVHTQFDVLFSHSRFSLFSTLSSLLTFTLLYLLLSLSFQSLHSGESTFVLCQFRRNSLWRICSRPSLGMVGMKTLIICQQKHKHKHSHSLSNSLSLIIRNLSHMTTKIYTLILAKYASFPFLLSLSFSFSHLQRWAKTLIFRDIYLIFITSVLFEIWEYSLEHVLPNFKGKCKFTLIHTIYSLTTHIHTFLHAYSHTHT